jgi:uncharacterized membrane protein SpoIIM required for sporulation
LAGRTNRLLNTLQTFKKLFRIISYPCLHDRGVLVGFHIDPDFGAGLPDNTPFLLQLEKPKTESLWSIAGNNISVALLNLTGGFSLEIVSLLNTFYNGAVLGYAFSVALDIFPVPVLLKHLLPHAIEILAIILSCSLGLSLGLHLFKKVILGRKPVFEYRRFFFHSAITLISVCRKT